MKKYIIILIILLSGLSCFSATYLGTKIPVLGGTISDKRVQGSVLSFVYSKVAKANKGCRKLQLVDTKVSKKPVNVLYDKYGKQISGEWQEEWTVDACGVKYVAPIDFEVHRSGTRYLVNDVKAK